MIVLEPLGALTLFELMQQSQPDDFNLNSVKKTFEMAAKMVSILHKKGYVHRNINMDAIGVKRTSN